MRFWLWFCTAITAALALLVALAWVLVPRFWPEWTIVHSPWVEPVLRAYASVDPVPSTPPERYAREPFTRIDVESSEELSFDARLDEWGEAAIPALAAAIGSRSASVRRVAVRGLVGSRAAIPPLRLALRDEDPWVRLEARDSLLNIAGWRGVGAEEALNERVSTLLAVARDPDASVRNCPVPKDLKPAMWERIAPLARDPATRPLALRVLAELLDRELQRVAMPTGDVEPTVDPVVVPMIRDILAAPGEVPTEGDEARVCRLAQLLSAHLDDAAAHGRP